VGIDKGAFGRDPLYDIFRRHHAGRLQEAAGSVNRGTAESSLVK
jgi:hypothetical protein